MKLPESKLDAAAAVADEAVRTMQELADWHVRLVDRDPDENDNELVTDVLVAFASAWISGRALLSAAAKEIEAASGLAISESAGDFL